MQVRFLLAMAAMTKVFALAGATASASGRIDPPLQVYAHPSRLVRLPDGRRLSFYCTGAGKPTVILTAGLGFWAFDWHKVQPALSMYTRVCSWDRAGYGYSDAPRTPETSITAERDLKNGLKAAGIRPPYILAGHSIGAIETRLFAARNPSEVVGMVLVDPTVVDQDVSMKRIAPKLAKIVDDDRQVADCERTSGRPDPSPAHRRVCDDPPPPNAPPALRSVWYRLADRPSAFEADLSMDRGLPAAQRELARLERPFGNKSIVVLTAGTPPAVPADVRAQAQSWNAYWRADHQRIARMSSHGREILVQGSDHLIEQRRPDAVVEAVRSMLQR